VWRKLHRHAYWYANGGLGSFAISAVDIALWDLKGKVLSQPLVDLLGGALRPELPVVEASHAHGKDPDEIAERIGARVAERGLSGSKVGFVAGEEARLGHEHERDVAFVGALRQAVGPYAQIMVDARAAFDWDVAAAVRRTRAFEEFGLRWIEEPLQPADLDGYRALRAKTDALVAFGERENTVAGYERILASGAADVVGFDPGVAGGVTGGLKVIERIEAAGRHFNAHAWAGAVGSAASLALSAATTSSLVFEVKPHRDPAQGEIVSEPLEPSGGRISPPARPGLGVEVLEEAVDHYRLDRRGKGERRRRPYSPAVPGQS
jgi:L-alanine-DL-glutamate epimerase-like enolase superfamily enzyme